MLVMVLTTPPMMMASMVSEIITSTSVKPRGFRLDMAILEPRHDLNEGVEVELGRGPGIVYLRTDPNSHLLGPTGTCGHGPEPNEGPPPLHQGIDVLRCGYRERSTGSQQ